MEIFGLFRCPLTGCDGSLTGKYNFSLRKIGRHGNTLAWIYEESFDAEDYHFSVLDVPFIRDLTEEEYNKPRCTPLPLQESDINGYICDQILEK